MEETKKLFSQNAITLATYLGGPVAAGYLIKKNYESFDQKEKGKKALIIGIVSTISIFIGLFLIPEVIIDKIPNVLIPAIYTAIIYVIVEKNQGQRLKEHKESGGLFYSIWKAIGIGAIFMVILLAMIVGTTFTIANFSQPDFDTKTYDKEMAKFIENEKVSIEVFDVISSAEPEYLITEFQKSILLWKENKEIVRKLNAIEGLPAEFSERHKKLLKYCDLRIQYHETIIKAITANTDEYDSEIKRLGAEINKIVEQLE